MSKKNISLEEKKIMILEKMRAKSHVTVLKNLYKSKKISKVGS